MKQTQQEIINRFKSGQNLPTIRKEMNISIQRVSQVLKQNGINPRECNRNNLNQKLDILSIKINRDLKDNLTPKQIVKKYKLSPYQVRLLKGKNIDISFNSIKKGRNQLINKLYMEGYTAKEIIRQVKTITTEDGVYKIVKELNGGILPKRVNTVQRIGTELTNLIRRLKRKHEVEQIYDMLLKKGHTNTHGKPLRINTINYYSTKC